LALKNLNSENKLSKNKKKSAEIKYIAIEDLVSRLGLLEEDVLKWIERDNPDIHLDHRGRQSVPITLIEQYANCDEYTKFCFKTISIEVALRGIDNYDTNQKLKEKRLKLLDIYESYISKLEKIHHRHLNLVNKTGNESSTMAAYLLFSRVISTLKMCCLCQRHDHWYWGSFLREIDECLAVAEHFTISKDTPHGKVILRKWFRENDAPRHADCREIISEKMTASNPIHSKNDTYDLINELYQKKSKFTHPTYLVIREITKYKVLDNGVACVEEIEYGASTYERKLLELTEFFKSSIWTSFQIFIQCFHDLPLTKEDQDYLFDINKKFSDEETKDFIERNRR